MKGIYLVTYNERTSDIAAKYPFSVYHTDKTSPFFENAYIRDLIRNGAHHKAEWFGVLSPEFFTKALSGKVTPYKIHHDIDRGIQIQTGRNRFERQEVDAIGFTPRLKNLNVIIQGNRAHGGGFSDLTQDIFNKAGIDWDVSKPLKRVVMSNYIIARPEVYQDYASKVLLPCMDVMESDPIISERVWKDSGYYKKMRMPAQLKSDLGVPYYPLHTFICERFWSVYLAMNPSVKFRHFGQ